jgi:hypothetical protein
MINKTLLCNSVEKIMKLNLPVEFLKEEEVLINLFSLDNIKNIIYKKHNSVRCEITELPCSTYFFDKQKDIKTKNQMLNYLYGKIYNYDKNIKLAPNPYYTLDKYYGNLSIQEYRQLLTYERLILIMEKPLTKIYPELHEDNNEFETMYDRKVVLKRTNKVEKNKIIKDVFNSV